MRLAASLERLSEHPLGEAIVSAAENKGLELMDVADFDAPSGLGVIGTVDGHRVRIGSSKFLVDAGIPIGDWGTRADGLRSAGATAVLIAVDNEIGGAIGIADPIRPTTPAAIQALVAQKLLVVMLTGDNRATAEAVAGKLGITEIEAEILPDQKAWVVERLRKQGRVVAMAGDG